MELLLMVDAARGASAAMVTAVIPHYAYARSDKKDASRISLGGRLVADLIATAGVDRVITMNLHAPAGPRVLLGAGRPPHRARRARRPLPRARPHRHRRRLPRPRQRQGRHPVLPPARPARRGGVQAAGSRDDRVVIDSIVGDVSGRRAIVLDDEIATGGSIVELLDRLADHGVTEAAVACTHGLFAGRAVERLRDHPMISEVVTTDTVPAPADWPELRVRSVAGLFAEAIKRIHEGESVSSLFDGVDPTHAPPRQRLALRRRGPVSRLLPALPRRRSSSWSSPPSAAGRTPRASTSRASSAPPLPFLVGTATGWLVASIVLDGGPRTLGLRSRRRGPHGRRRDGAAGASPPRARHRRSSSSRRSCSRCSSSAGGCSPGCSPPDVHLSGLGEGFTRLHSRAARAAPSVGGVREPVVTSSKEHHPPMCDLHETPSPPPAGASAAARSSAGPAVSSSPAGPSVPPRRAPPRRPPRTAGRPAPPARSRSPHSASARRPSRPGVRTGDVYTVLRYVAVQVNSTVEALYSPGCWGHNYREISGSTTLSNHASGTAIDVNAPDHPLGASGTFTSAQVSAIRTILTRCNGVVRWGGDYSGRKDEMHFEINVGPGDSRLSTLAASLGGGGGGTPPPSSWPLVRRGDSGFRVTDVQHLLRGARPVRVGGRRVRRRDRGRGQGLPVLARSLRRRDRRDEHLDGARRHREERVVG